MTAYLFVLVPCVCKRKY